MPSNAPEADRRHQDNRPDLRGLQSQAQPQHGRHEEQDRQEPMAEREGQ
jgi:hypothetical protein